MRLQFLEEAEFDHLHKIKSFGIDFEKLGGVPDGFYDEQVGVMWSLFEMAEETWGEDEVFVSTNTYRSTQLVMYVSLEFITRENILRLVDFFKSAKPHRYILCGVSTSLLRGRYLGRFMMNATDIVIEKPLESLVDWKFTEEI
jgi:hypothetical protein